MKKLLSHLKHPREWEIREWSYGAVLVLLLLDFAAQIFILFPFEARLMIFASFIATALLYLPFAFYVRGIVKKQRFGTFLSIIGVYLLASVFVSFLLHFTHGIYLHSHNMCTYLGACLEYDAWNSLIFALRDALFVFTVRPFEYSISPLFIHVAGLTILYAIAHFTHLRKERDSLILSAVFITIPFVVYLLPLGLLLAAYLTH